MVFGKWRRQRSKDSSESEGSDLSGGVWMSNLLSNPHIGNKQGLRSKFFGRPWQPARFEIPLSPTEVRAAMQRYAQGNALERTELPEAAAVWDEKSFKKVMDIFTCGGGVYVVKGKLAEVLSRFDLGDGGLIPFSIFKADLETAYPGEFFLLNFGCIKNTLLPEQCEDAQKFFVDKNSGLQVWKVNQLRPEGKVVVSSRALVGPDLWFEEAAHNRIFVSDALAQALIEIGMGDVFKLKRCQIV